MSPLALFRVLLVVAGGTAGLNFVFAVWGAHVAGLLAPWVALHGVWVLFALWLLREPLDGREREPVWRWVVRAVRGRR